MAGKQEKTEVKGSAFEWPLIRRILSYVRPYRWQFFLALFLTISLSIVTPVIPYLSQYILDNPVPKGDVEGVRFWIMVILGVLVMRGILMYFSGILTGWLGQTIIRDIRNQVFRHVQGMRLSYFDKTPVGTLQTRTISDVETLNDVFSQGMVDILGQILQLIAIFAMMLFISWQLTLVVLTTVPLLLWATYIFKNKVKSAFQGVRKYVSLMNAFLQEHITGMLITQIFNRENKESERFRELNKGHRDANLNSVLYYSVFFPVVEIITALATALLVWYGTGRVLDGTVSFGVLVSFIMYINMFFRPIRMLADRFNILQLGMVSAERIFKVLDTDAQIEDIGTLKAPDSGAEGVSIEFERVNFAYEPPEWILKDVSFRLEPGKKLAIVGSTGAGKTTVINLLARFYEIQRGTIRINDTNIRDMQLKELRGMIGLVLQDVFMFSGTIYENITLNSVSISREAAMEAAKAVGAHDFIMKLPGGYDYQVQERGATLSAGQRQLIAFARVLAFDPGILVLDEATSNIDTVSEELIQKAMNRVLRGRTAIIIAHRLSTIQSADKILVMSKGQIEEEGDHQELLAKNGMYHRLYQLQYAEV